MNRIFVMMLVIALTGCSSKEEQKNKAEEEGNFIAAKESRFIQGVGEALKDEGKDAAESISEGAGEVFKGLNTGFDKSLVKINVKATDEVKEYFTVGRTGKHYNDTTYQTNVIVYTVFNKDFKGKLVLKAFDKENAEIGRKTLEVNKKTDDAEYIDFVFDKRTPLSLADYYTLEIKK